MAAAPFHDVRIHPRTGQETPINVGDQNNFYTTDQTAYDPETLIVAAIEGYDSKYGVQLQGVPKTGSVKVFDVTEPTSPVELVQTNSVPATGRFWVSTPGAQSDYGIVNLGFGFVEVNSDINGHTLEVHYQSLATIPNIGNIDDLIVQEVQAELSAAIDAELETGGSIRTAIDDAVAGSVSPEIAWFKDIKSAGTAGGTFTSGAWRQRDINDLVLSDAGITWVTLASNQLTIDTGTYDFYAECPGRACGEHKAKLADITNTADSIIGSAAYAAVAAGTQERSIISGKLVVSADNTVFQIQHRCTSTEAADGFGLASGFSVSEVYTQGWIRKIL